MNELRVCRECLQSKPIGRFKKNHGKPGTQCLDCYAAYMRARRLARGGEFRERCRERMLRWRRAHGVKPQVLLTPEERRERKRERMLHWRRAHGVKPRVLLTPEQRREKHRERNRLYRERHPEKHRERCRRWHERNPLQRSAS